MTDLYDISSGLSKSAKFFGSGHPFVAFKDVMYNYFLPNELSQLVQSTKEEQQKCSVNRGDVFLTRTSETMNELGMSSVAVKDYEDATFNGFTKRLRPKPDTTIVPEFVAYYLRSPKFRSEMRAFSTMSTRASLNNEMISRLKISFPSVLEQRVIGGVLKTLDDKIELNRQMNETLESMARALFQSWFVDFDPVIDKALAAGNPIPEPLQARAETRRALANSTQPLPAHIQKLFPDAFQFDEEMGWIPEGWKVTPVGEAITINPRVSLKKGAVAKYVDMKSLPTSGFAINEVIEKEFSGGAKFLNADVLMARITPCLENGKAGVVDYLDDDEPGFGSTEFIVLRPKNEIGTPFIAALVRDENFRAHCVSNMVGSSGRQRVQNSCFDSYFLCLPSKPPLLTSYHKTCSTFFARITKLKLETNSLTKLRDTLLPKLLSGEIRIPDAEKLVANSL
ncbi:restriction endonuclease subunit S [Blastopirellula marina]|uniref:restriction endonuclease subunit S n=1 Tax=Blastopirellula marina TaxID=124 RepID=UPI001929E575|nr:restriction endonuclease subunit S [Blastopirellula marina]